MKPTNPGLWATVKKRIRASSNGGEPGRWSARKAVIAQLEYKSAGGKWSQIKAPKPRVFAEVAKRKKK